MKQMKFTFFILVVAVSVLAVSCSRPYYSQSAPVPRPYVSLIISPSPGFTMNRYPDGRYYHRSPQGFLYWKGYDNRFFLDHSYINRVNYNQWEYNEWKRYNDRNKNYRRYR